MVRVVLYHFIGTIERLIGVAGPPQRVGEESSKVDVVGRAGGGVLEHFDRRDDVIDGEERLAEQRDVLVLVGIQSRRLAQCRHALGRRHEVRPSDMGARCGDRVIVLLQLLGQLS